MSKVTSLTGAESGDPHQGLHLRNIPAEPEANADRVGQDLREARLKRGEELAEVSQVLRISKHYLEALETDRPDKLPGRTYAIGFVRAYASYLGLDAASLVSRYKLATQGAADGAPQVGPPPEADSPRLGLAWILGGVVVAGLLAYGIYELSRPAFVPTSGTVRPKQQHAQISAAHPAKMHPLRSSNVPPTLPSQKQPAANAVSVPSGQVLGQQNRNARLILHAGALARVLIQGANGRVYLNRILHPGDVYRVPNVVGLSLTTPDAGAISLELDGRDMGVVGRAGHMAEALSLDPRSVAGRKGVSSRSEFGRVTQ